MIQKELNSIEKNDIGWLVENQIMESRTLDYKRELPGGDEREKVNFLKLVSAFANTAGGDIVYGVIEEQDEQGKNTGLPKKAIGLSGNLDEAERRMHDLLQSSVSPRIPGLQFQKIPDFEKGPVLVVRVPASWMGPHMVIKDAWGRFYARGGNAVYILDVDEIREAFAASQAFPTRLRQFREDRAARFEDGKLPYLVGVGPKTIIHLVPVSALMAHAHIELQANLNILQNIEPLAREYCAGRQPRFNFDGYVIQPTASRTRERAGYVQVFRSGIIEAVGKEMLDYRMEEGGHERIVYFRQFGPILIRDIAAYLLALKQLGVSLPVYIALTLARVHEFALTTSVRPDRHACGPIDRNMLFLPDVCFDNWDDSVPEKLRPIFDVLWQSAGISNCPLYDEEGNWTGDTL